MPAGAVGLRCDHTDDAGTATVFERVAQARGRLDVLVNCAWAGYEDMTEDGVFTWSDPFWEQPAWRWEAMFDAGVRPAFVASQHAARLMIPASSGLIVNLSYWSARKHIGNVLYGMSKAATDKLTADAAEELAEHGVTVVSLYPGLVRTERVMEFAEHLDLSGSESPRFTGRAVAALAADPDVERFTGQVLVVAELARQYGFDDVDGRVPEPLTLETA